MASIYAGQFNSMLNFPPLNALGIITLPFNMRRFCLGKLEQKLFCGLFFWEVKNQFLIEIFNAPGNFGSQLSDYRVHPMLGQHTKSSYSIFRMSTKIALQSKNQKRFSTAFCFSISASTVDHQKKRFAKTQFKNRCWHELICSMANRNDWI